MLAAHGHDLVLTARNAEQLKALACELVGKHGIRAEAVAADLGDPLGIKQLASDVVDRGLEIDVLVNNAGIGMHGAFAEDDPTAQVRLLQLNVVSLTQLTRLLLPGMLARRSGRILNVASTAAFAPGPFMTVYYASKAYVLSLSVGLANELAGTGVTVTALCPGPTRTKFQTTAGVDRTRLLRVGGVMEPAQVARSGYEGMMAGKAIVVPGVRNRLLAISSSLAPRTWTAWVARALQEPSDMT